MSAVADALFQKGRAGAELPGVAHRLFGVCATPLAWALAPLLATAELAASQHGLFNLRHAGKRACRSVCEQNCRSSLQANPERHVAFRLGLPRDCLWVQAVIVGVAIAK